MCTTTEAGTWCAGFLIRHHEGEVHAVVKHFLMEDYQFRDHDAKEAWDRLINKAMSVVPAGRVTNKKPVYEKGLLMKVMDYFGYDCSILRDRYMADFDNRQDYYVPMKPKSESAQRIHDNAVKLDEEDVTEVVVHKTASVGMTGTLYLNINNEAQPQENEMKTSYFKKITFVGGNSINGSSAPSVEDAVGTLRKAEKEIKDLKKIKTKSKAVGI